ncbi:Phosphoacetylglucosamine mutase [Gossypium arboreum]|uniref:Phosphoacetylglucosamine mutase n=1 Tax=Gossypium arboreum TaxID=29729 RepID=A0A0B0PF62_GOSAR|nr:Phosphoacetylglucosamine mutase [Gossypium arboreum]
MSRDSSPSAVHSNTQAMASTFTDGVLDTRFFSTKKISVLLDDNNYLLWRQQVLLAIKTYKLQGFLDTTAVPPPPLLPDADGVLQENPDFARFEQQDSALASWLLSSVSQSILPHLIDDEN